MFVLSLVDKPPPGFAVVVFGLSVLDSVCGFLSGSSPSSGWRHGNHTYPEDRKNLSPGIMLIAHTECS